MLRPFIPVALALLLAPSVARADDTAADALAAASGPSAAGQSAEAAARSGGRASSERKARRSTRPGAGARGDDASRGESAPRERGDDASRGESAPRERGDDASRDASAPRERGDDASRGEPAPRERGDDASRDASGPRERGDDAPRDASSPRARPERAPVGGASGSAARPAPSAGEVRNVRIGVPGATEGPVPTTDALSGRAATAGARATANFRGADLAGAGARASGARGDAGLAADARPGRADADARLAASAARHGGGSDAVRATHGDSAARSHAAAHHARATAASHRAAAWHRAAAPRRHAWARAWPRHGHRPYGWFHPWRPGHGYWYHGVFVYGPYPWHTHTTVFVDGGGEGGGGRGADSLPEREVDRTGSVAVGLRAGSYMGGYRADGGSFGDAGLGVALRYRPVEAVGLELSWMHHDQSWEVGTERAHDPLMGSVQLFALPWTKVNPYVLAGVTVMNRQVHDDLGFTQVDEAGLLWGPHAGIGLELGVGTSASVSMDARYTGYLNAPAGDLTVPGAVAANMGLNFYF